MMIEQNKDFSMSELAKLEKTCRLSIAEEDRADFLESLRGMIALASLLREAKTDAEPYSGNLEASLSELREDRAQASFSRDVLLSEAPEASDGFIRVPKTVEA